MAYAAGLILIDAPASALNNAGAEPGARTDNTVAVKYIRSRSGERYPYVSAQAFRYWLRDTLQRNHVDGWQAAPVFREEKVAYTDANPLMYWDDDLLGYMRAPSKKRRAKTESDQVEERAGETPTEEAITRSSPFRVSTLVSIAPVEITSDFGVMARQDGDPVPFEHQFYRTTLMGLISLNLSSAGTFTYLNRSGYKNLDATRRQQAETMPGIEHLEAEKAYRLPLAERSQRIAALFDGLSRLEGGAKQSIHYTDVAPCLTLFAVLRGGNNPFAHVIGADRSGRPELKVAALLDIVQAMDDQILSPIYLGWAPGYLESQRQETVGALESASVKLVVDHPRRVFQALSGAMSGEAGLSWLQ